MKLSHDLEWPEKSSRKLWILSRSVASFQPLRDHAPVGQQSGIKVTPQFELRTFVERAVERFKEKSGASGQRTILRKIRARYGEPSNWNTKHGQAPPGIREIDWSRTFANRWQTVGPIFSWATLRRELTRRNNHHRSLRYIRLLIFLAIPKNHCTNRAPFGPIDKFSFPRACHRVSEAWRILTLIKDSFTKDT